jgi:omega-amidase
MKVYCCQLDIAWENKEENYRKVRSLVEEARPEAGSMVVLPEMFSTGFSMNVPVIAEIAEGGAGGGEKFARDVATEYGVTVVAGLVTRGPDGKGLNEAVVISPRGEMLARYAKIHPFSLGGELENYSRGKKIQGFQWNGIKVVPFICYDLRFPEVFRSAVRGGAEMFVVIANWPNKREQHWVTLLQARAIENLAYVVGVNRAGEDPKLVYPGRTMIVDPHGNVLADAGLEEGMISATIEADVVRGWRKDFPALQDIHWRD